MGNGESRDAARRALTWLAHPISVLGLALLLLNDHVLKAWQPGPVTGKLSDVAGLVMFPPLLAVLAALVAPRLPDRAIGWAALVATGAGFAFVKSTAYGADLASQAWSVLNGPSVIRADRTDLLTLPALAVAWWAWRRAAARRPAGRGLARLVRGLVLVPVALVATVATAAPSWPETVWLGEHDGQVVVGVADGDYGSDEEDSADAGSRWLDFAASTDDGVTWYGIAAAPEQGILVPEEPSPGVEPTTAGPAGDDEPALGDEPALVEDCAGDVCYRVVPGELHVQSSQDGGVTWTTAWRVAGAQLAGLTDAYEDEGLFGVLGTPAGDLSSQAVLVREVAGGHVVLVANGRDGLLRRDVDGQWTRLGSWWLGELVPPAPLAKVWEPSDADRRRGALLTVGAIALLVLTAALVAVAAGRRALPVPQLVPAGLAGGLAGVATTLAAAAVGPALGPALGTGLVLTVAVLGGLAALALARVSVALWRQRALAAGRLAAVLGVLAVAAFFADLWRAGAVADGVVAGEEAGTVLLGAGPVLLVGLIASALAVAVARWQPPRDREAAGWRPAEDGSLPD